MTDDKKEALERFREAVRAGNFEYGGRQEELDYLREAIARETDADARRAMQERLDYVEARSDAEMMEEMGSPKQKAGDAMS